MAIGSVFAGVTGSGGTIGGATVRLVLDSGQFDAGLAKSQSKLQAFGAGMSKVGAGMTRSLTVPIVAAGAVATKMAMDYEEAFTKIRSVTTAADEDINKWKASLHTLAAETGVAATDLAEGLYFIAQPSLDAAETMDILELSAKGAALGLGEMGTVGMTLAQVMNAYSKTGQTATDTMDTWTAAVMAGVSEPEEWAGAMGKLLGIAAQSGLEFENLAASLASLTSVGVDVNEGVIAMRGFLMALVAPGSQAADTMKEVGLSAEELRGVISEEGLLGAMRLLEDRTGGNIEKMREIVPNVRALAGFMNITGQEAKTVDEVFRMVADSTGTMDEAFGELQEDPAFKMRQSMAQLKSTAIEIGSALLPVVTKIVQGIGDLVGGFTKLSPVLQENIVKWALIVAAAGPLLRIFGGLIGMGGKLVGLFSRLGGVMLGTSQAASATATAAGGAAAGTRRAGAAAAGAATSMGGLSTVVGGLAVALTGITVVHFVNEMRKAKEAAQEAADAVIAGTVTIVEGAEAMESQVSGAMSRFDIAGLAGALFGVTEFETRLEQGAKAVGAFRERVDTIPGALTPMRNTMLDNAIAAGNFQEAMRILKMAVEQFSREATKGMGVTGELKTEFDRLSQTTVNKTRAAREDARATREAADANARLGADVRRLGDYIKDIPKKSKTDIEANTNPARSAIEAFIDQVTNRTYTLTFTASREGGGWPPGFQHGGRVPRTDAYMVGEAGPEMVLLPGGANVIPNNRLGRGGGAGAVVVNIDTVNVGDSDDAEDVGFNLGRGLRRGYLQKAGLN